MNALFLDNLWRGTGGNTNCKSGYQLVTDQAKCQNEATTYFNKGYGGTGCWQGTGCLDNGNSLFFSTCSQSPAGHHQPICEKIGKHIPLTTTFGTVSHRGGIKVFFENIMVLCIIFPMMTNIHTGF